MAKILVVDDEIGIRELLADILSDEGYYVDSAENAASARKHVSSEEYDLILLDIWMPDTDGITLLKEWTALHQINCPVIMMSGHASIDTAVEATKFGALAFLEKPIGMQKLLEAVKNGLEVKERIVMMAKLREEQDQKQRLHQTRPPEMPPLPRILIPGTNITLDFNLTLREVREAVEKGYLLTVMHHESWQMTKVAARAGLERTHLYRKLKSLDLSISRANGELDDFSEDETADELSDFKGKSDAL